MSLQRFEAHTLEAALEEARTVAGPGSTVLEANRLRRGGIAGFFAKERYEVAVEVPDERAGILDTLTDEADRLDVIEPASPVEPTPVADVSTERAAFSDLVARLAREQAAVQPGSAASTPQRGLNPPEPAELAPAPSAGTVEPLRPRPAAPMSPLPPAARGLRRIDLDRVGLPDDISIELGVEPGHALLAALSGLPSAEPLPIDGGTVLAVVGPRDEALALARSLANDLGLDPADVALAAEDDTGEGVALGCLLPSTMAVSEARCSARFRSRPFVIAVAIPFGRTASSWGRRVIEALDPTTVWATVDAGRKPEDVREWTLDLGGVDALAVSGLDDTASPASVLATGIPVAQLDGRPASAALWTALLLERMAA